MSVEYEDSGITFENRNFDGVLWYQPRALTESLNDSVTPYVRPENTVFSEMRIKSVSGREPSNFYEVDEQGEEE